MSVQSRRQALSLCFAATVVVIVQMLNQLCFEVLHRRKGLQIQQVTFGQAKEVFDHDIAGAVAFAAADLPDALCFRHLPVLLVLILPTLTRMQNEIYVIWNFCKSIARHCCYHRKQGFL